MIIARKIGIWAFSILMALSLLPMSACATQEQDASQSQVSSQSAESSSGASANAQISVTVEVDASQAKDQGADVSALEAIAGPATYEVAEGATAYDALVATGASLEGDPSYVTSIDGLSEGEAGASSGWMYEVNSETPMVAANECVLNEGDVVRWYYSSWE